MYLSYSLQFKQPSKQRALAIQKAYRYLRHNKIPAFYSLINNMTLDAGVTALLECVGIGKMKPNILLMGYKSNWRTCPDDLLQQYFSCMQ